MRVNARPTPAPVLTGSGTMTPVWAASLLAATLLALTPGLGGEARASGLEIPEQGARAVGRGGAFSAKADDPTAGIHNPGALVKLDGLQLMYSHNLVWHFATFTRAESVLPPTDVYEGQDPFAPVENETPFFGLGGTLAAAYGVGDWTFGFSIYGPNSTGKVSYPSTGGQRYMLTEMDSLMLFYGASVAWGTEDFGIGATFQAASLPRMRYSLVTDGVTAPIDEEAAVESLSPYSSSWDVEATLALDADPVPTGIIGAWWRPHDAFEIALSGRVVPVVFQGEGDIELANVPGQSPFTEAQLEVPGNSAKLEIPLPMTARLGLRYVHRAPRVEAKVVEASDLSQAEIFDIELDVVYEAYSIIESFDADLEGSILLAGGAPVQDVSISKRWRDTFSVRLGGTWNALPGLLKLSLGGYFEQGASHPYYTHLDFLTVDRVGIGAGLEAPIYTGDDTRIDLVVAYAHTFQEDRTVAEQNGKVVQQRPIAQCPDDCGGYTGVVANAGTFESSFDLLSMAISASF